MLVQFTELTEGQQIRLTNKAKEELLQKRNDLLEKGYDAESVFYTKLDYINNYKINSNSLYHVCSCGNVLELDGKIIYDKISDCQQREVLYKCKCNNYNKVYT